MSKKITKSTKIDYEGMARFLALAKELSKYRMEELAQMHGIKDRQGGEYHAAKYEVKVIKK